MLMLCEGFKHTDDWFLTEVLRTAAFIYVSCVRVGVRQQPDENSRVGAQVYQTGQLIWRIYNPVGN